MDRRYLINLFLFLSALGIIFIFFSSHDASPITVNKVSERDAIRHYIENIYPEITGTQDEQQKVLLLRNLVYSRTRLAAANFNLPVTLQEVKAIFTGKQPVICGGMALLYYTLLDVFGINSRLVYIADEALQNNHALVEVFVKGKWVIEDPTYNIHWQLNNKPLNTMELLLAYQKGEKPVADTDGLPLLPDRVTIEQYPVHYKEMLAHILIQDIDVFGQSVAHDYLIYPDPIPWTDYSLPAALNNAKGTKIKHWNFPIDLEKDWKIVNDNLAVQNLKSHEKYILLTTDHSLSAYQIRSNAFSLVPGVYQLVIDGRVIKGGISAGILNQSLDKFVATKQFIFTQFSDSNDKKLMMIPFEIKTEGEYSIVLSNYSLSVWQSQWEIKSISILH